MVLLKVNSLSLPARPSRGSACKQETRAFAEGEKQYPRKRSTSRSYDVSSTNLSVLFELRNNQAIPIYHECVGGTENAGGIK